jgi:glutathione S-transferase
MSPEFTLVSHALCPYVQRVAIVLAEKGAAFERREVELGNKPDWFKVISPLGKTPVLLVGQTPIFESAVICEYLDEIMEPRLHPSDALERAQHRAWMEFGSSILNNIAAFYNAPTDNALTTRSAAIRAQFEQLEAVLGPGPYFVGNRFSMLDAVFGPIFRYFDVFDGIGDFGFFRELDKLLHWRAQLSDRASVKIAVRSDYPALLKAFLLARRSALSGRMISLRI